VAPQVRPEAALRPPGGRVRAEALHEVGAGAVRLHPRTLRLRRRNLHDVHERIPPILGVWLAKEVEKYQLFFLEDLFAPEDQDYFRMVREQCSTPIAMGELWNNPHEVVPMIRERLIDFIRIHI
jgi:mannonate dehydratase